MNRNSSESNTEALAFGFFAFLLTIVIALAHFGTLGLPM